MAKALRQEPVSDPRIRKTPGVCGGDACIRDLRMPVWLLVEMRQLGLADQTIIERYRGLLQQEDLDAAWSYAARHGDEIARAILENGEA
jgi:uncharacterized protein (DUF433 family)